MNEPKNVPQNFPVLSQTDSDLSGLFLGRAIPCKRRHILRSPHNEMSTRHLCVILPALEWGRHHGEECALQGIPPNLLLCKHEKKQRARKKGRVQQTCHVRVCVIAPTASRSLCVLLRVQAFVFAVLFFVSSVGQRSESSCGPRSAQHVWFSALRK